MRTDEGPSEEPKEGYRPSGDPDSSDNGSEGGDSDASDFNPRRYRRNRGQSGNEERKRAPKPPQFKPATEFKIRNMRA
jgi:hypothetical protein